MSYSCKILLDSVSETGKRLTTFEIKFPRIVLAEFNTHRMFSRNSASSRAIPLDKQLQRVQNGSPDLFIPERFPINCSGMQPQEYIDSSNPDYANHVLRWLGMRDDAVEQALLNKQDFNWHKQLICRDLELFQMHTVIVTATEFNNFFKLRTHSDAQYEIKRIADLMYDCYNSRRSDNKYEGNACSLHDFHPTMKMLKVGEWHCPLVYEEDEDLIRQYCSKQISQKVVSYPEDIEFEQIKKMISVARCARVSYLTHDGKRDIEKDLELCLRLRESGHWSPFEHVATPDFYANEDNIIDQLTIQDQDHQVASINGKLYYNKRSGNFIGFRQYRKEFQDENCTNFRKES